MTPPFLSLPLLTHSFLSLPLSFVSLTQLGGCRTVLMVEGFVGICLMVELMLKLIGYGPMEYFRTVWNKIDFVTIIITEVRISISKAFHSANRIF